MYKEEVESNRWRVRGTLQGESTTYVDAASSASLDASHPTPALQPPPQLQPRPWNRQAPGGTLAPLPLLPKPPALAGIDLGPWPRTVAAMWSSRAWARCGDQRGSDQRALFHQSCSAPTLFPRSCSAATLQHTLLSFLRCIDRPHPAVTTLRPLPQLSPRPSGRRNTSPSLIGRPYSTNTLHFILPFIKDSATESHATDTHTHPYPPGILSTHSTAVSST